MFVDIYTIHIHRYYICIFVSIFTQAEMNPFVGEHNALLLWREAWLRRWRALASILSHNGVVDVARQTAAMVGARVNGEIVVLGLVDGRVDAGGGCRRVGDRTHPEEERVEFAERLWWGEAAPTALRHLAEREFLDLLQLAVVVPGEDEAFGAREEHLVPLEVGKDVAAAVGAARRQLDELLVLVEHAARDVGQLGRRRELFGPSSLLCRCLLLFVARRRRRRFHILGRVLADQAHHALVVVLSVQVGDVVTRRRWRRLGRTAVHLELCEHLEVTERVGDDAIVGDGRVERSIRGSGSGSGSSSRSCLDVGRFGLEVLAIVGYVVLLVRADEHEEAADELEVDAEVVHSLAALDKSQQELEVVTRDRQLDVGQRVPRLAYLHGAKERLDGIVVVVAAAAVVGDAHVGLALVRLLGQLLSVQLDELHVAGQAVRSTGHDHERPEPIVGRDCAIVAQLGAVRLAGVQLVALDARHTLERRHVPVQPVLVSATAACCRICSVCRRTCHFNSIETILNQGCTCLLSTVGVIM